MGEISKEDIAILELLYRAKDQKKLIEISSDPNRPEPLRTYAAALLGKPWLPWGVIRKVVMFVLVVVGFTGYFYTTSMLFFIFIIIALSFSPRLVADTLVFFSQEKH